MAKEIVLSLRLDGISKEAEELGKVEKRIRDLNELKKEYIKTSKTEVGLTKEQEIQFNALNQELAEQKQVRTSLNKELNTSIKLENAEAGSIDKLRARNSELRKEMSSLNLTTKEGQKRLSELRVEYDKNNKTVRDFDRSLSGSNTLVGEYSKGISAVGGQITSLALGFVSLQAAIGFVKDIINTRAEFQKFEVVLENTLGSAEKARNALDMVSKFAAETPFSVQELTDAFIKLTNQGFQPTREQMVKLGDLASSTGKSFDQLSEAILDAQTNQFERLKEFGIKAKKEGDNITFTFKEQETTVKANSLAIRDYILSLGELPGVMGANAKIAESLTGQISNLGDNWDNFLNSLGKMLEYPVSEFLKGISSALGGLSKDISNATDKTLPLEERLMGWVDTMARANPALYLLNERFKEFIGLNDALEERQFKRDLSDAKKRGIQAAQVEIENEKKRKELEKEAKENEAEELAEKNKENYKKLQAQKEKQSEEAKKKASEEFNYYLNLANELQQKQQDDAKEKEELDQKEFENFLAQTDAELQVISDAQNKKLEIKLEAAKKEQEIEEETRQKRLEIAGNTLETSMQFANIYTQFLDAKMQSELLAAEGNEAKKEQIRKEYAKKRQTSAIAETIIGVAQAVVNAMNTVPFIPMGLIAASIAGAQGAIQIKAIKSQKFNTGGLIEPGNELPGSQKGTDNTLILAKPGEVVLNESQQNRAGGAEFFKRLGVPGFATGGIIGGVPSPSVSTNSINTDSVINGITSQLQSLKVILNVNELHKAENELSIINKTNLL